MIDTCSVDDCSLEERSKGYCNKHYLRQYKGQDLADKPLLCAYADCDHKRIAKGYCDKHYRRFKAGRDLADPPPVPRVCAYEGCNGPRAGKGYCQSHYVQLKQGKSLHPLKAQKPRPECLEDLLQYTEKVGDCLIWQRIINKGGYGQLPTSGSHNTLAHRLSYEFATGQPIPQGLAIHHKCANRLCINPEHLQLVTQAENMAEMLERNYYINRIAALESALAEATPDHPLLERMPTT